MEFVGRILLIGQRHEQFYEIVKKKKIKQLINLSFYSTPCWITYIKTDRESLKLEQRALKNHIKTKI